MSHHPVFRRLFWIALSAGALLVLVACNPSQPVTPEAGSANPPAASVALTPLPVPTATPLPGPTATPEPTATPSPTPTPPAVVALDLSQAGQTLLSVRRAPLESESLWRLAGGTAQLLARNILPDHWRCAGAAPRCTIITVAGGLLALDPEQEPVLLDALDPGVDPAAVRLALSPDARRLALAAPGRLSIFDLETPGLLATLATSRTQHLVWSPDAQTLAAVFQLDQSQALGLWPWNADAPQIVALMDRVEQLAWSHDSSKIAFIARHARTGSLAPASDLFVLYPESGEIYNLSETTMPWPERSDLYAVGDWPPIWQADDSALRYVRGPLDDPASQMAVTHPVTARQPSPLWPASDEGLLGILDSADGRLQARLTGQEQGQLVEVRPAGGDWVAAALAQPGLTLDLAWTQDEAGPALLIDDGQTLRRFEPASGQLIDLAAVCAECQLSGVRWLP